MDSTIIRPAEERDAEGITALIQSSRAYEGAYASIIEGFRIGADYIDAHEVFVATEQDTGELLGFYALVLDPPELDLAFVADAAQGRGIGRLLVEHMVERAREGGLAAVRVVAHPPAEGFYRSLGAQRVGTVRPSPPKVPWERPELRFLIEN